MPGKFALREEQAHLTKKLVKYIALACLIVIMALIATLAILNHNKKKLIEPISFSSPTSSPTMLFIEEGLITSTSTSIFVTPTDTPVPTQIISPTPTEIIQSPTPIRIREPHQLEIPFGKEVQFVIHKIVEGEALLYLAEMYRTTTDTIQAVNFGRLYVWPDYLIIIPKDIKDASTLPAFELFMIEQSGLTPEQVASTLSIDLDDFLKYNDLQTGDELFLGEWLLIPRDRIPG